RNCWSLIALRKQMSIRWCRLARRFRRCYSMMNNREGMAESRTLAKRLYEEFGARRTQTMHAFHIHYRNTQGTLMRILTAVSRRGLEIHYLQASASGSGHRADILLEVNP